MMKPGWIRPTSSILCLLLMLTLLVGAMSGCGGTESPDAADKDKKPEPLDHYRLSHMIVQAPGKPEEDYSIQTAHITTDAVYFVATSGNSAPDRLYCASFDGGDATLLYTAEDRHFVELFSPGADGDIWFLENEYKAVDENGNGDVDVYIKKIDKTGAVQANALLKSEKYVNGVGTYYSGLAVNDRGQVFVAISDLDEENQQILDVYWMEEDSLALDKKVTSQEDTPVLSILPDGRAAIAYLNKKDRLFVRPINTESAAFEDEIAFNANTYICRGNGHFTMLRNNRDAIYKWEDTEMTTPLIVWTEYAVDDFVKELTRTDDGALYGMVDNGGEVDIIKATPCTASEAVKTVTIAGNFGIDESIRQLIKGFNKSQSDYIAILKNYADYSSDEEIAYTKLETELMAGSTPDVLCLNGHISNRALISKGVLQDLYPYLDKDDEVNRDFFVEEILPSLTVDGKLYQVATGFTLDTMIADRRVVGDKTGLTFAHMEKLQKENPDKSLFFKDFSRDKLMTYLAYSCFTDFIRWETGECRFESEAFVKLLETAKSRPTIVDVLQSWSDSLDEEIADEFELLKDGKILLITDQVNNVTSYLLTKSRLGDNAVYIGFPSENGTGTVRYTEGNYGILAGSKNKEGAWQFLRWMLLNARDSADPAESADPFSGFGLKPFPASREAFDEQLAYFQTGEGAKDDTPLTDEDVTMLKEIIKTAKPATNYDREIAAIIEDEASYFFADKCTVAQAAKKIQERVSIYVNEQQ